MNRKVIIIASIIVVCAVVVCVALYVVMTSEDADEVSQTDNLIAKDITKLDGELEKSNDDTERKSLLEAKVETYKSIGDYGEALKIAQQLDTEFPNNPSYKAYIATIYELDNDGQNAAKFWREAIAIVETLPASEDTTANKAYYQERLTYSELGGR